MAKTKTIWTPEMAYAVGLIVTDGTLSKDRRHMEFVTGDYDLAVTFQRCLGIRVKIGKKQSGYRKDHYHHRVQFGDVLLYRWLVGVGLMPNKSKQLEKLRIPKKYFQDFLRGCFDGDGTIYSYWDLRWKSSFCYYVGFTSASPIFLMWLRDEIESHIHVLGRITKGNGAEQLKYSKHSARKIVDAMYYKRGLPCLQRKLVKVQKILTIQKQHARVL